MPESIRFLLQESVWGQQVLPIVLAFVLALVLRQLSPRLARRLARLDRFSPQRRDFNLRHTEKLRGLIASFITFVGFLVAIIFSIGQFVEADTLVWMVGLFSAAFGLGARPLVNDYLAGISFIFDDTFDVGEKVEILGTEGIIERVNLRSVLLRSPSGEQVVIPNGEIRVVRNYSRGRFSEANVTVTLATADLERALPLLEELGSEAPAALPNLLEPWKVIATTGEAGQRTGLTLLAKARYGKAAEMRPRLMSMVQQRLAEHDIELS